MSTGDTCLQPTSECPPTAALSDLTAELTELLGTPDSELRELALAVLCTWIERGVYDDLLPGLGDGIATGLLTGIGERETDSVFRRSFSALVVAEVIDRDIAQTTRDADEGPRVG